jgi:hypothetical protein
MRRTAGRSSGGASIRVYDGTQLIGTTRANSSGFWTLTTTALADGDHLLSAAVVGSSGTSPSLLSNRYSLKVDTVALAPGLALANDTGTPDDGISSDGTVNVSGIEAGAAWQYSIDSGTNWQNGSGTSFTLPQGTYAAGVVLVRQTDAAGNASANGAFSGTIKIGQTVTFTVAEASGVVSFGGTATGEITITIAADGTASFAREGVTAAESVANVGGKLIDVAADSAVVVVLQGTGSADTFTLNVPNAGQITLKGALGDAVDSVVIKVDGVTGGSADTRTLKLVTSDMTGTGDRLVFDFADDLDLVVLTAGSVISNAFVTLEIKRGTVDLTLATFPSGLALVINSGAVVSVEQLIALGSVESLSGQGGIQIAVASDEELEQLTTFLATAPSDFFVGTEVEVAPEGNYVPDETVLADFNSAVEDASVPVFTVSEAGGVVTFGGNASGAISVSIGPDGTATFTRELQTATVTVTNLNTKCRGG